jgi:hypothetical protein
MGPVGSHRYSIDAGQENVPEGSSHRSCAWASSIAAASICAWAFGDAKISLRSHVALGMSTALSFQHAASDRIAMTGCSRCTRAAIAPATTPRGAYDFPSLALSSCRPATAVSSARRCSVRAACARLKSNPMSVTVAATAPPANVHIALRSSPAGGDPVNASTPNRTVTATNTAKTTTQSPITTANRMRRHDRRLRGGSTADRVR